MYINQDHIPRVCWDGHGDLPLLVGRKENEYSKDAKMWNRKIFRRRKRDDIASWTMMLRGNLDRKLKDFVRDRLFISNIYIYFDDTRLNVLLQKWTSFVSDREIIENNNQRNLWHRRYLYFKYSPVVWNNPLRNLRKRKKVVWCIIWLKNLIM